MKKFSPKQTVIVNYILDKKMSGVKSFSLDELTAHLKSKGMSDCRRSNHPAMEAVMKRLNSTGIYVEKISSIGRGKVNQYLIQRPAP